jgi:hypothetical protein
MAAKEGGRSQKEQRTENRDTEMMKGEGGTREPQPPKTMPAETKSLSSLAHERRPFPAHPAPRRDMFFSIL